MPSYETKDVFAKNLARYLAEAKETQVDLARVLGVSKSTVSSWFTGEKMPRMDKIEAIAAHFGVLKAALLEPEDQVDDFAYALMDEIRPLSDESKEKLLDIARHLRKLEQNRPQ